jgi:hypothetical protein
MSRLGIALAGRAGGFTRQGRTSAWFENIIKGATDTQKVGFFIGLDEVLAQYAAGSMYTGDGSGTLSAVSAPPGGTHAHSGGEGRSGWSACDKTFLHGTVESSGLLLRSNRLDVFLSECIPAPTPLLVLFTSG